MSISSPPVVVAHMLIRRPAAEVYAAFVDPAVTTRFWFSASSGPLEVGANITWTWAMYGASGQVQVQALDPGRRILIAWPTPVEWTFSPRGEQHTFVTIRASGFSGSDDEQCAQAVASMGGFSLVLAGCKALLEHGIALNLTADHNPDAHVSATEREA